MTTGTTALPYGGLACALEGGSPSSLCERSYAWPGEGPGRAFANANTNDSHSLPFAGFTGLDRRPEIGLAQTSPKPDQEERP